MGSVSGKSRTGVKKNLWCSLVLFVDINEKSVSQSYNTEAWIGIFLGLVYDNGPFFGNSRETRGKNSNLLVKAYTTCSSL